MAANRGEEFDGCKRTVGDEDNMAIGKPAMDLQGGLARPIKQRLGRARLVGIEAFGGGEHGEKGQRHDAIGPRHLHQQMAESQRRPLALTKCPLDERTGSR